MTEHVLLPRSGHLKSAAHDGETLEVLFQNGERYRWPAKGYKPVSEKEYQALIKAPSAGTFLHGHIIKWHGKGVKVEPE